jgi:hypothetical protein
MTNAETDIIKRTRALARRSASEKHKLSHADCLTLRRNAQAATALRAVSFSSNPSPHRSTAVCPEWLATVWRAVTVWREATSRGTVLESGDRPPPTHIE